MEGDGYSKVLGTMQPAVQLKATARDVEAARVDPGPRQVSAISANSWRTNIAPTPWEKAEALDDTNVAEVTQNTKSRPALEWSGRLFV